MSQWAFPPPSSITGVISVSLNKIWVLVIMLTTPGEINWDVVREFIDNPERILTTDVGGETFPWVYRVDDYAVGLILGWLEQLTGRVAEEIAVYSPIPGTRYYFLI